MGKPILTAIVVMSMSIGCSNSDYSTLPIDLSSPSRLARGSGLPTCSGASDCVAGPVVCSAEDGTALIAPTTITDAADGVSSDGRGPYIQRIDGVRHSTVVYVAGLSMAKHRKSVKNPRRYSVNLNNPVAGGGGVPLGIITDSSDMNIEAQWYRFGDARQSLHKLAIGQTVRADQVSVSFHVNGRFHVLQMGPQAYGHCLAASTQVHGTGTSLGTIYRASATKWVIDLPPGSVGRLFDLYNTTRYAVDRGLYYTQLHYEIGS